MTWVVHGKAFLVEDPNLETREARQQLYQSRKLQPRDLSMYSQILSVLGDVTARLGQVRDELVDAEAADTNRFIYRRRADVEPCTACEADAEEFSLMLR